MQQFCDENDRVAYNSFPSNRGPHQNTHKVLSEASSTFCMLLSDEDYLEPEQLPKFLDFLESLRSSCSLVSCAVFDEAESRYYYHLGDPLHKQYVGAAGFTILSSTTYMSGYAFKVEALQQVDLSFFLSKNFTDSDGPPYNAYGHIDIAQRLLTDGIGAFYMDKLVVKGRPLKHGGHAFSHRDHSVEDVEEDNLDLNIKVYGPYSRVRQYFYREMLLSRLRENMTAAQHLLAQAQLYRFFFERLLASPQVTKIPTETTIEIEIRKAVNDVISTEHYSNSEFCRLFAESVLLPNANAHFAYEGIVNLCNSRSPEFCGSLLID